jgi:hypothetical protein
VADEINFAKWGDTTIEWLPLGSIRRDQRVNTRPVDDNWVQRKVDAGFDPNKFGTPTVSARSNGQFVWLDGQNRGALARASGVGPEAKVQAVVFHGLTRDQEAAIFLGLNDGRSVAPIYKFLAKVAAREPRAVAVNNLLKKHGWRVAVGATDGYAQAVTAFEYVYDLDGNGGILDQTVAVITTAWGHRSDSMRSVIVKGVAAVINRYGALLDLSSLADHLKVYRGASNGVYSDAKGLHSYRGGSIWSAVAEVVVNAYNKKRRTNRVEEWSN